MLSIPLLFLVLSGSPAHSTVLTIQCNDALRLTEALIAAGLKPLVVDGQQQLTLDVLDCGAQSGPPEARRYACQSPKVSGARARALVDALATAKLPGEGATMQHSYSFKRVRCGGSQHVPECHLSAETYLTNQVELARVSSIPCADRKQSSDKATGP